MGWIALKFHGLDRPQVSWAGYACSRGVWLKNKMGRKKSRGGARRQMVPPVDQAHLEDALVEHVKKLGVQSAFSLGKYAKLEVQQAAVGEDLVRLLPLLQKLHTVQPSLEYKYSDLEQAAKEVLRQFPDLKECWPLAEQVSLSKTLAHCLLVLCNHCRRVGTNRTKFLEASRKLTQRQLERIEEVWWWFNEKEEEKTEAVKASPAKSANTEDLLEDYQIPPTQESADSLLEEAEEAEPVPVRKRALREAMKKPSSSLKRPGAAPEAMAKKKAKGLGDDFVLKEEQAVHFMTYKTGAVALRISGGPQLLQVLSHKGPKQSNELAQKALSKLKSGETLGKVRAWKAKELAK